MSYTVLRSSRKVYMKYTVETWFCKKHRKEYASECHLTLLFLELVESLYSNYSFNSAKKRRIVY